MEQSLSKLRQLNIYSIPQKLGSSAAAATASSSSFSSYGYCHGYNRTGFAI